MARTATTFAALVAGLAGALTSTVTVLPAVAADHREAPTIQETPAADLNDIYVFRSPTDASRLVLVMTVNPIADPDFATTYNFSPDVLYRFAISNAPRAEPEIKIDFLFTAIAGGAQTFRAFLPNGEITGDVTRPTVAAAGANAPVIKEQNGVKIFAGPRDDPFFFDGVGFSRVLAGSGGFRGQDSFATFNVSAIVVELPFALLRGASDNDQIEVTGVTFTSFQHASQAKLRAPRTNRSGRTFFQADRTGNPAVATALVPPAQRDAFNFAPVSGTSDRFAGIDFTNTLVATLTDTFKTPAANIEVLAAIAVPDTMKFDVSQPDGFPNGRRLQDDVIDTILQLVLDNPGVTDNVGRNDRDFLGSFPYLAPPQQAN